MSQKKFCRECPSTLWIGMEVYCKMKYRSIRLDDHSWPIILTDLNKCNDSCIYLLTRTSLYALWNSAAEEDRFVRSLRHLAWSFWKSNMWNKSNALDYEIVSINSRQPIDKENSMNHGKRIQWSTFILGSNDRSYWTIIPHLPVHLS